MELTAKEQDRWNTFKKHPNAKVIGKEKFENVKAAILSGDTNMSIVVKHHVTVTTIKNIKKDIGFIANANCKFKSIKI